MTKKVVKVIAAGFVFLCLCAHEAYSYSEASKYLCDIGLKFYKNGRDADALQEFKKALLIQPDCDVALQYIQLIEQRIARQENIPSSSEVPKAPYQEAPQRNEQSGIIELPPVSAREMQPEQEEQQTAVMQKEQTVTEAPVSSEAAVSKSAPEPEKNYIPSVYPQPAGTSETSEAPAVPSSPEASTYSDVIKTTLDIIEREQEEKKKAETPEPEHEAALQKPAQPEPEAVAAKGQAQPSLVSPPSEEATRKKTKPSRPVLEISLDAETLSKFAIPIEIEQGSSVVLSGKNIQRFLATQPGYVTVSQRNPDELLVTAEQYGYSDVLVWDDNGRWNTEFLIIPVKSEGPTAAEMSRKQEEKAHDFKLRYALDWISYEKGKGILDLRRTGYSWSHSIGLDGETPYGDFYSSAGIGTTPTSSELTYLNLKLTRGRFGTLSGFNLEGFDFSPNFSNIAFPSIGLRGAMLNAQAFNKQLEYTAFWGREGGGSYGTLSPNLTKTRDSFLEGFNLNYSPDKVQNYAFMLGHGFGRDRETTLNRYGYDFQNSFNFKTWSVGSEMAFDSENFAYLLNYQYRQPKFVYTNQFRDINKIFKSLTGTGWNAGQLGTLSGVTYTPTEQLLFNSTLDLYRDGLNPAPENPDRWNEDVTFNANYQLNPVTAFTFNHSFQNDLGKISQSRFQNSGVGFSTMFKFLRDISTYANATHQENTSFSAHSSDSIVDRLSAGLRFNLIGSLSYYAQREYDWLTERSTGNHFTPNAFETGLDWSHQIGRTPFNGRWNLLYHDERNALSPLSFLSGQDYLEGYSELTYRPDNDTEFYGSTRIRNIWASNPNVTKGIEATFNAGMRYVWDTGVRWDTIGNIEGYVFKDLNGDGLRQRDEPPIEGMRIWVGKNKLQVTDLFGYYSVKGMRARKTYVNFDASSLPPGFVLTVPSTQEVSLINGRTAVVNFGITSRSEISGLVFEDVNGNGEYDRADKGLRGVVLTLENGQQTVTDETGRYYFPQATVGNHTLTLDLNSLPIYYLPKTALVKEFTLNEGVTYIYNIPLKRIKE